MATYYVAGTIGNDSWDGTSPTFVSGTTGPKATLNGIEDKPVAAGDLVWVRSGVYRETLTVDVSGSSGNPIEYRADVSGQIWSPGGIVRITGSDNDQTATRTNAISASTKNYRTFTGFYIDTTSSVSVSLADCQNWIIQDCVLTSSIGVAIQMAGANQANCTICRCLLFGNGSQGIFATHTSNVDNSSHLVENCVILAIPSDGVRSVRVGNITVRNSTLALCSVGVRVATALTAGQLMTVNNCIITSCSTGLQATTTAEFSEDYNTVFACGSARSNVNAGANSVAHSPLFAPPLLLTGFRFPWMFGALSQWSTLAAKAGTGEATDDLFGTTRPATSSKKSWGAVQFIPALRDTGTVRTGTASLKLSDAGSHHMFVPVTNVSTTISLYVRWEADYAGTKPQMVIRQPGQSDITVTATGSAGAWELLSHTFTPAASPGYVVVVIRSSNSATSGSYACYWDDLAVS